MKILPIGNVQQNSNITRTSRIPFGGNTIPVDDVRNNFTFERSSEGLLAKDTIKGAFIAKGKSYGQEYNLHIDKKSDLTTITGKIGTKGVEIKSERQGSFWRGYFYKIEGYVGNKKVSLVEKPVLFFNTKRLYGKLGNEDISLTSQHFRYNDMITGPGVNMQLMYYAEGNKHPKYLGKYELSPEFLPILAGLTRFL